jgi:hypothetical protein
VTIHLPLRRIGDSTVLILLSNIQFLFRFSIRRCKNGRINPFSALEGREELVIVMREAENLSDGGRICDCHGEFSRGHLVLNLLEDGGGQNVVEKIKTV